MRTIQRSLLAVFVGLTLATPTMTAQAQDIGQALQGLLTGNQDRDRAVQQAYERGYQRGRNDEARQWRERQPNTGGYNQNPAGYYQDRGSYNNRY